MMIFHRAPKKLNQKKRVWDLYQGSCPARETSSKQNLYFQFLSRRKRKMWTFRCTDPIKTIRNNFSLSLILQGKLMKATATIKVNLSDLSKAKLVSLLTLRFLQMLPKLWFRKISHSMILFLLNQSNFLLLVPTSIWSSRRSFNTFCSKTKSYSRTILITKSKIWVATQIYYLINNLSNKISNKCRRKKEI